MQTRLSSLPSAPAEEYHKILETRLTKDQKTFAKRILSWLFYARSDLKMQELQEVLTIKLGQRSLNLISTADNIIHACGSLVDNNKETDRVAFSHELVRQYVEDQKSELLFEQ